MIGCETRIRKLESGIVMLLKEESYFSKYVNILCENLVDNNKIWIDFQKLREMTCVTSSQSGYAYIKSLSNVAFLVHFL